MPLNGLYIIATPFFSRDSIQRQIVAIVAWLLRTFLRAKRHARVRQRRTRRMDELGSCRAAPSSSPTGNRFGILVSLRERQQPVGHRCAVVASAADADATAVSSFHASGPV